MFTSEELRVAVDEAHRLGLMVTAHAHGSLGLELALKAGVDRIEHGTFMTRDHIELFLEHNAMLVPTRFAYFYIHSWALHLAQGEESAWRSAMEAVLLSQAAWQSEVVLKAAIDAGVRIGFGSDVGAVPHLGPKIERRFNEFTLLQKVGLEPEDLVRMATIDAAQELGLEDHIGKIEVGFEADIIAVPDFMDDLPALTEPVFVMSDGVVIKDETR